MVKGTNSYTEFPINRRHQGLVTSLLLALPPGRVHYLFPINRRHQGLATLLFVLFCLLLGGWFPIYGRHQGLATIGQEGIPRSANRAGFQSIGVTKEWRRVPV